MRTVLAIPFIAAAALVSEPVFAQPLELEIDATRSTIEFTLDATLHTVHGTFRLASGTVRYDPETGEASGKIVVDARSGQSGNTKRDRDMHVKVLQSERYPAIELIPERVVGVLPSSGSSEMRVVGSMRLAGSEHPVEIPVTVTVTGREIEIRGRFQVPYVEWGLRDPSKLVLRVAKEVAVTVTVYATVTPTADSGIN